MPYVVVFVLFLLGFAYKVSTQYGYISLNARVLSDTQVLISRHDVGSVDLANLDFSYRRHGETGWSTNRFNPTREYFPYTSLNRSTLYYFRLAGRAARTYNVLHAYTHVRTPPYPQHPPSNVTAVTQNDGSVVVSWAPAYDGLVVGYVVIYSEVDNKDRALTDFSVKPVFRRFQTTLTDIKRSSRYKIEVASMSLDGEGTSRQSVFIGHEFEPFLNLSVKPHDIKVQDEGTVILTCMVDGFPSPKIEWRKSGRKFDERKRRFFEHTVDGMAILRIDPVVSRQDKGTYTCTATNSLGTIEKARAVVKTYKSKAKPSGYPMITHHPVLQYVEEGSKVAMNCTSEGKRKITTQWFKNSFPIVFSEGGRMSMGLNARLIIVNVQKSDEGTYECSAENGLGTAFSYPAHLYVTDRIQRTAPPVFLHSQLNYNVQYGDGVSLSCHAVGKPVPDMWWERGGKRQRGASLNGQTVLFLQNVKKSEQFTCVASNTLDTIRRNYTVSVRRSKDQASPSIPVFKSGPETVKLMFRGSTRLMCEAFGEPEPRVFWTTDDGEVRKSERGVSNLRLYRLRHSGNYTCTAVNTEGEVSQVYVVNVEHRGDMVDRPIKLKLPGLKYTEVDIRWQPPINATGVIGFVVYVDNKLEKHRDRTEVGLVYKYTVTNLQPNTLYHIRVSSLGVKQEGLSTKFIRVRTLSFGSRRYPA